MNRRNLLLSLGAATLGLLGLPRQAFSLGGTLPELNVAAPGFTLPGVVPSADGAIEAIAEEAHRRKTGARALRGIVEELMLDLMYDLPSQSTVKDFTVTRAMVEEHTGGKVLPLPDTSQQKSA